MHSLLPTYSNITFSRSLTQILLTSAQMGSILPIRKTEAPISKGLGADEEDSDKEAAGGAGVYPR